MKVVVYGSISSVLVVLLSVIAAVLINEANQEDPFKRMILSDGPKDFMPSDENEVRGEETHIVFASSYLF